MKKEFLTYEESKKSIQKFHLTSNKEWRIFAKSKQFPKQIPTNPDKIYKNNGWTNWGEFLNTNRISNSSKVFKPFHEAKKIIHQKNLKNNSECRKFTQSKQFPSEIPANPDQVYKNKGWSNWEDWLGTKADPRKITFKDYEDARSILRKFKISNSKEWQKFAKSDKKTNDVPADAARYYKNKGWISWGDFLSTGRIANQNKKYLSCSEAKKFVHSLGLKNQQEWRDYCNSGKKPDNIPTSPEKVYSRKRKNAETV